MYCYNCMKKNKDGSNYCVYCANRITEECAPHHLKPGTVLNNKYLVGKVIGEGGFGITYIGLDLTLDLRIAIKEFYPSGYANRNNTVSNNVTLNYSSEGEYFKNGRDSFLQEAKSIAKFSQESGIVDVRDFFVENETAYIIMEYLDGENLSETLKNKGRLSAEYIFDLFLPIMRTLDKMHKENIIHRDISPENIRVLKDGSLRLIDFGSARYFAGLEKKTMSVQFKQGYAPFEQYSKNSNQGPWTDVYGLCATLYKCITGKVPVDSLERCQSDTLKKPSELGIKISPALENVLMYGLAVYPENRCRSMEELIRITGSALQNGQNGFRSPNTVSVNDGVYKAKAADAQYKTMFADNPRDNFRPGGNRGVNSYQQQAAPPQKKKPVALVIVISSIALLLAVGVVIFILFFPFQNGDDKKGSNGNTQVSSQVSESESETKAESKAETKTEAETETINLKINMPDVSGKKLSDATNELEELGLVVETEYEESTEVAEGYIIRQSIAPDRLLNKGDTVLLYVAEKPEDEASDYDSGPVSYSEQASGFSNASASSVLPDQEGYNYSPQNVLQNDSTCWVENDSGYGIGEWIKLELPTAQSLNGLQLVNGYAGTEKQYTYNSKIKKLKIEFSGGQTTTVELRVLPVSDRKTIQVITFDQPVETEYVKLTILEADKGECADTCLTYVAPY